LPSAASNAPPTFETKGDTSFSERSDYRILLNDWPYGVEPTIKHICVWLKIPLDSDETGGLSEEGSNIARDFIHRTFEVPLGVEGQDKVLWFQNPTAFQSVRAISHLHVFVRGLDDRVLNQILEHPPFDHE
jgi:Protein of unknown function (DUF3605)